MIDMSKLNVNLLKLKRFTSFLSLVVFILCFLNLSFAQTSVTTEKLEGEINTYESLLSSRAEELNDIDNTLGNLSAQFEVRIRERDNLSNKLFKLREEHTNLQNELEKLAQEMQMNEERLEALSGDLSNLQLRLQEMLLHLHRQSIGRYARVLVESESFFDLRVRSHYLSLLATQDVELVHELQRTVTAIEKVQKELSLQVAKRNESIVRLEQTQRDVEVARQNLNQAIAELEANKEGQLAKRRALIREQESLEQTIASSQQALRTEVARLQREAEEARQRAEAAQRESERQRLKEQAARVDKQIKELNVPVHAPESGFYTPVQSARLVMSYNQEGPYVYLQAPQAGAAVYSTMSGVITAVAQVSANSGYLVTVQHSQDLVTAYLNLQRPFVKVGDQVTQGQTLAYLGGGTLIPANNLQFRVGIPRSEGRMAWVDPAPKLGIRQ